MLVTKQFLVDVRSMMKTLDDLFLKVKISDIELSVRMIQAKTELAAIERTMEARPNDFIIPVNNWEMWEDIQQNRIDKEPDYTTRIEREDNGEYTLYLDIPEDSDFFDIQYEGYTDFKDAQRDIQYLISIGCKIKE